MTRRLFLAAAGLALLPGCKPESHTATGAQVDYNKDIQPIFAERCYHCHGPDPGSRKAGLRLDMADTAFAKRPGKPDALVKGDPDHSELMRRIRATDKSVMPPRDAVEKPLDDAQKDLLRRWIAQGAKYRPHWAFEKPVRPAVPTVAGVVTRNPIDAFIFAKLAEKGLKPNAEAGKTTLVRRVTLDLTGLLPTPAETEDFLKDTTPDAYEKLVDRLLASPAYGENMARHWLDYARYGDSHGMHGDNMRSVWPYRDYVIRAFNENKSFDKFVTEQLAGDLSGPTDVDAIIATGFVRCGISTGEGGTITEELRVNNKRERTEAYGAVFLGLTVGCANCHDHKFDPTTQKDFFALSAFFNNLAETPSNNDRADWPPNIRVPVAEKRSAYNAVLARRSETGRAIEARRGLSAGLIRDWLASGGVPKPVSEDKLQLRLRLDENKGRELRNSAPHGVVKAVSATLGAPLWGEVTWFWPTFRMDSTTCVAIPEAGDFGAGDAFSAGSWIMPRQESYVVNNPTEGTILSRMEGTGPRRGWDLYFDKGKLLVQLVADAAKNDAITVSTTGTVLQVGRRDHVFFTYDGSRKAAGVKIFINGVESPVTVQKDTLTGDIRTTTPLLLGSRHSDADPLRQSRYQDLRVYARALPPEEASRVAYADRVAEVAAKPQESWTGDEAKVVSDYYFANVDKPMRELVAKIPAFDKELDELSKDGALTLVCRDTPDLAYADVLARGDYSSRLERVRPAVPGFLPALPKDAPRNRRGLAAWTLSAENPLTARVTVNRMWNEIFGAGLVPTTEDFGIMGDRPSHPELLDWLAVEFRESGWDMKRFYRLLVTSDAYRRDARVAPEIAAKDPGNRFLARGPRHRLEAEVLRDTALQASGLLSTKIGGPSVKPYQPPGIWEAVSIPTSTTGHYVQDKGESLYRKSLYTFSKRMAISPAMETLDAPVRDAACTRRMRTNTPLQALVTMNAPQWIEASRFLAERALREGGPTADTRFDFLGRVLLGRPLTPKEHGSLGKALTTFTKVYAENPVDADALLSVGEKPRDPALSAPEVAAWTLVSSAMFNLDETLND